MTINRVDNHDDRNVDDDDLTGSVLPLHHLLPGLNVLAAAERWRCRQGRI